MNKTTITRDEAIAFLIGTLTRFTVDAGAKLAGVMGTEFAADLTLSELERQADAFEAIGVSEDEVRRIADELSQGTPEPHI